MKLAIIQNNHKTTSPATLTPEMDRKIWRKLPVELLERILSFLPLKTFISLQPTCKYFRSLLFSPLFLSCHSNSFLSSFLLLSHPQSPHYHLYDTVSNTWRNSNLSLPRTLSFAPLVSTSTSLFCFSAVPDFSNSAFLIHNLLARSSRVIKFPEYPFIYERLTLITNHNGYKLFCLSSGSSKNHSYVYDSRTRIWSQYTGFDQLLGESYHQEGVLFNECLYFATREPFLVVSFDLSTKIWAVCEANMPEEVTFVRLISNGINGNRLFMFGGIGRNGISRSMKIWELELDGNNDQRKWNEIESVPELMCRKFGSVCYHNYERVYCFWHQGMICVCCYTWPEVLYYKVSRRTWYWVPKCPSIPDKWSCGFKWFSFVPQLYGFV
uniref:F-box/kelch-repeat protein At5g43190 n=1 Tax=Erigeron canadensis TaxID=72917 RepID=UPI001CB9CEBE|nr:F-box/kelch-repeat protein At5g43190 [Erigeron canadensis]